MFESQFTSGNGYFVRVCLYFSCVSYLTGVVAPEPPLDELFGAFPCIGDGSSLPPEFACDISHESTSCRVAFLCA